MKILTKCHSWHNFYVIVIWYDCDAYYYEDLCQIVFITPVGHAKVICFRWPSKNKLVNMLNGIITHSSPKESFEYHTGMWNEPLRNTPTQWRGSEEHVLYVLCILWQKCLIKKSCVGVVKDKRRSRYAIQKMVYELRWKFDLVKLLGVKR